LKFIQGQSLQKWLQIQSLNLNPKFWIQIQTLNLKPFLKALALDEFQAKFSLGGILES